MDLWPGQLPAAIVGDAERFGASARSCDTAAIRRLPVRRTASTPSPIEVVRRFLRCLACNQLLLNEKEQGHRPAQIDANAPAWHFYVLVERRRRLWRSRSSRDLDRLDSLCPTRRRVAIAFFNRTARAAIAGFSLPAFRPSLVFSRPIRFQSPHRRTRPIPESKRCDCRGISSRSCEKPRKKPKSYRIG